MLRNRRIRNVTPKAYTPFEDHCTYVLSELSKKKKIMFTEVYLKVSLVMPILSHNKRRSDIIVFLNNFPPLVLHGT